MSWCPSCGGMTSAEAVLDAAAERRGIKHAGLSPHIVMKYPTFCGPAPARCLMACLALGGVLQPAVSPAQRPPGFAEERPAYDQWTTYLNPRFGFQVPVPPGLRAQSDPFRGSSWLFLPEDGALALKVWGAGFGLQPGDPLEQQWRKAVNQRGRRVDFQRRTPRSFVLAGVNQDGSEFYEKVILGSRATAGINISYPPSMVDHFASVVHEIEEGFGWAPEGAFPEAGGAPAPAGPLGGPAAVPPGDVVDLTPPPPKRDDGPAAVSPRKPVAPAVVPKPVPAKREDLPYGIAIPGKKGYVYSPYHDNKQQVDVTDIPTGTKVKCPYTGKVFRVP